MDVGLNWNSLMHLLANPVAAANPDAAENPEADAGVDCLVAASVAAVAAVAAEVDLVAVDCLLPLVVVMQTAEPAFELTSVLPTMKLASLLLALCLELVGSELGYCCLLH